MNPRPPADPLPRLSARQLDLLLDLFTGMRNESSTRLRQTQDSASTPLPEEGVGYGVLDRLREQALVYLNVVVPPRGSHPEVVPHPTVRLNALVELFIYLGAIALHLDAMRLIGEESVG